MPHPSRPASPLSVSRPLVRWQVQGAFFSISSSSSVYRHESGRGVMCQCPLALPRPGGTGSCFSGEPPSAHARTSPVPGPAYGGSSLSYTFPSLGSDNKRTPSRQLRCSGETAHRGAGVDTVQHRRFFYHTRCPQCGAGMKGDPPPIGIDHSGADNSTARSKIVVSAAAVPHPRSPGGCPAYFPKWSRASFAGTSGYGGVIPRASKRVSLSGHTQPFLWTLATAPSSTVLYIPARLRSVSNSA